MKLLIIANRFKMNYIYGVPGIKIQRAEIINPDKYSRKNEDSFMNLKVVNPLSANPTKWSNTLRQFVRNFPTNCLSVFDGFVKLGLKGLKSTFFYMFTRKLGLVLKFIQK